jgi:uncharacterized protein
LQQLSSPDLSAKAEHLQSLISSLKSVAVAFSGGVDSALLLAVCQRVLGTDAVLALTVESDMTPRVERERAAELAERLGARHRVVPLDALGDRDVVANRPDRCYHCKRAILHACW